ncbi:substrate-binding domain-containing protein [Aminithiophilus ramosus]|uniref:Substrate-binding domain-containing protein n=1 Tax=Aminithiophilus ramosus TaxID=3029084 RepID=A0A9Q7A9I1_9BACT|nr:substrate-binding domain-containing protein [Aminithiophilus ramosus]QTX32881.1 substrate-binding domain-containing protein [Aminithiophilus ramosus]
MMKKVTGMIALVALTAGMAFADAEPSGKGMKVWFDGGGSPGEPYTTIVVNGAKQAAADLGVDLTLVYSDWNAEKMLENFKNGLAAAPTGFVVMGHPGDDAFEPLVDEAFSKGMIVTAVDTELPRLQGKYQSRGFGYVGPDGWKQGEDMAREILRRKAFKPGDKAFVWGLKRLESRGRRARAMLAVFEEAGLKVDYLEISDEINKDVSLGAPVLTGYLAANPDCRLVVIDHGGLTGQMENFLRAAGLKPGDLYATGFSLNPATAAAIESGYLNLVSEAQPYLMGYFGVLQIVQTAKYGFGGLSIDTGGGYVSAENIASVAPLAKEGIR